MNNIKLLLADERHIELLIEARVNFFLEMAGEQPQEKIAQLKLSLREYLQTAVADKTYVGCLAMDGDIIAGAGGIVFRQRPGSFTNLSGWEGYIMSMYTAPQYRKQGIATAILHKLVQIAEERDIKMVELHATPDGEPVYVKSGFKLHTEPTYRIYMNKD